MELLGQIFPRTFAAPAWRERLEAWRVLSHWEELVGQAVAQAARPLGFSRGMLLLEVEDSLWMQRLKFEEKRILALLNKAAGKALFKGLRLVLSREGLKRKPFKGPRSLPTPSPGLLARVEREVAPIEDPELREAFKKLRLTLLLKAQRGLGLRRYSPHRGGHR